VHFWAEDAKRTDFEILKKIYKKERVPCRLCRRVQHGRDPRSTPLPTSRDFTSLPSWRSQGPMSCIPQRWLAQPRHIIIGKHTGTKALKCITLRMGYYLKDEELVDLSERVKMCRCSRRRAASQDPGWWISPRE